MDVDGFIETAPALRFAFSIKAKVGPIQDLGQTARGRDWTTTATHGEHRP